MSERLFIIGAGQVGRGLSRAFRISGVEVVSLHGRRSSDFATSSGDLPDSIRDANVIMLAVRDPQIAGVVAELSGAPASPTSAWPAAKLKARNSHPLISSGTVLLHTSGIAEVRSLDVLRAQGFSCGTFHPLAPFSVPDKAAELLRGGWIGVDGDDAARSAARRLAGHLGARTIDIPPGGKTAYHAAAVMASNFPVALAYAARALMNSTGITERSAQQAVESLMRAALANLSEKGPVEALTGPVVRGDPETIRKHLAKLAEFPELDAVYRALSSVALRAAQDRGTDPGALAAIRALLT